MKLIIDIPTDHYNEIVYQDVDKLRECVKNGTVIVNEADVDCVSRKKLLGRIDAERRHLLDVGMDGAEHIIVHHARRIIEDMPSVKPQRAKGRWIEQTDKNKKLYGWFYCSECGAVLGRVDGANYCSECGAEMEGSNE